MILSKKRSTSLNEARDLEHPLLLPPGWLNCHIPPASGPVSNVIIKSNRYYKFTFQLTDVDGRMKRKY